MSTKEEKGKKEEVLALQNLQSFLNETREWLLGTANDDGDNQIHRDHERLFSILQQHPNLAREDLVGYDGDEEMTTNPLDFLLAARAPLEMVEQVYHMHPGAVKTLDSIGYYPLHCAVLYSCSFDVVEFLLEKFPQAAQFKTSDTRDWFPLQCLIRQLEQNTFNEVNFCNTFKVLYESHPPCQWEEQDACDTWEKTLPTLMSDEKLPTSLVVWLAKQVPSDATCYMDFRSVKHMSVMIQNLNHFIPLLSCPKLHLQGRSRRLVYKQLKQFISTAPPTLTLDIENFLDPHLSMSIKEKEELCQVLQESKSTAILDYFPWAISMLPQPVDYKIGYLSAMNHHGRAKIASINATPEILVDCLCSVHGHSAGRGQAMPNLVESVWYGLLREAPGLWAQAYLSCNNESVKKRPAVQLDMAPKVVSKKQKGVVEP